MVGLGGRRPGRGAPREQGDDGHGVPRRQLAHEQLEAGAGFRVEGGEESEMGTQASREGAGRVMDEVPESSGAWPANLDVVASRGCRGAWRAREGARTSGFELNQGRESWFYRGATRGATGGGAGVTTAATAMNGVSRERRWR